jgi:predicted RND superfamily exporter protein
MSTDEPTGHGAGEGHRNERLTVVFEGVARKVVKHPGLTLLALTILTVIVGSFITDLRINNDGRIYFIEGDPMLAAQERFEQTFGSEQFVMFFLEGDEIFTREGYDVVNRLVKTLEALDYKGKPAFVGILDPFHAPALKPGADSLDIAPILDKEDPTDADLAEAKRLVTGHPVYSKSVVNPDGTIAAVLATMRTVEGDTQDYSDFIAQSVTKIFDSTEGLDKLNGRLVGGPVFGYQMNIATAQEAVIYGIASVLVALVAMMLLFRRIRQVFAALAVVVFAAVWAVGVMAGSGAEMSLIHTLLPPAIIVTGLGSAIHVINEFRLLATSMSKEEAAIMAVGSMGGPCLLTALTTGIGFLAMLTAPVAPMRSLGLFISIGVFLSFILAMLLVPAALMLGAKDAVEKEEISPFREWSDRFFVNLADKVTSNAPAAVILFAVLAAVLIAGLARLEVDSTFLNALRKDHPFRETVEYVDEKMGGSSSIELVINTGDAGGVYDPAFLERLAALQDWIESSQGDVVWVTLSIADLFKEINYAVVGRRTLPESRAKAAELVFLYDVGGGGGTLSTVIDNDKRRARLSCRTRQMSSARSTDLEKAIRDKALELFSNVKLSSPNQAPPAQDKPAPTFEDKGGDDDIIIIDDEEPAAADGPTFDEAGLGALDGPEGDAPPADDGDDVLIIEDEPDDVPGTPTTAPATAAPVPAPTPAAASTGPSDEDAGTMPLGDSGMTLEVAGTTPLFAKLNEYIISSQMKSFSLAAIIIAFIMGFMLRSFKLGLAIMFPNILPIFATYGLMGWTGVPMDFLTAVIAVAAIGVAVDGTIHIGIRYRRSRLEGMGAAEAARSVMTSVGRALVVTSMVLTCGFLVLIPSMLASLATFGVFMAFCLFLALLYDIIMTPAVLTWLRLDVKDSSQ